MFLEKIQQWRGAELAWKNSVDAVTLQVIKRKETSKEQLFLVLAHK